MPAWSDEEFDAAEMPRPDAFDEEFGREPIARTGARFWTVFSIALGVAVIGVSPLVGRRLMGGCA
jgi:hypothetical protein